MTRKRIIILASVIGAVVVAVTAGAVWYMTRLSPNAVLMYHCIDEVPQIVYDVGGNVDLYVTPSEFEAQLKWLNKMGYTTGFASDCGKANTAILTFDDGYADFYRNAYPLLKKYNAKATVFLIASLIGKDGYLDAEMIREMADSGLVEFHSHTVLHTKLDTISGELLSWELAESKRRIETITGCEVYAICYPNGAYNDEVLEIAAKFYTHGFTTIAPKRYDSENPLAIRRMGVGNGCGEEEFRGLVTAVVNDK